MSIFDQIASAVAADFVTGPTVNPQYQAPQRTAAEGEDTRIKLKDYSNKTLLRCPRCWESEMVSNRPWVGLSVEDKKEYVAQDFGGNRLDAMDWAEKRLKEKNTNA